MSGGLPWRAWVVVPGQTRASAAADSSLVPFQDGWICFESRVPRPGDGCLFREAELGGNITDEELPRLLEQAIDAPIRDRKQREPRTDR